MCRCSSLFIVKWCQSCNHLDPDPELNDYYLSTWQGCGIRHITCRSSDAYVRINNSGADQKYWNFVCTFSKPSSSCSEIYSVAQPCFDPSSCISPWQSFCLHFICFLTLCFIYRSGTKEIHRSHGFGKWLWYISLFKFVCYSVWTQVTSDLNICLHAVEYLVSMCLGSAQPIRRYHHAASVVAVAYVWAADCLNSPVAPAWIQDALTSPSAAGIVVFPSFLHV